MKYNKDQTIKLLEENIDKFTKSQKRVADYIISNPTEAAFLTIDQISDKVRTSTATVVRMALTLGYSGYAELQKFLQQSLKYNLEPASRLVNNAQIQEDELIREITRAQLDNIDDLIQNTPSEQLYQAAEMLEEAILGKREVYICGNRSCYGVASYLSYNMNRMFGSGTLLTTETFGYHNYLNKIKADDVVIVISFMRYTRETLELENLAKGRGAKIIAVTDSLVSPMVDSANLLFKVSCNTKHFHNSTISVMLLFEQLIGILAERNRVVVQENLEKQEKILKTLKIHVL